MTSCATSQQITKDVSYRYWIILNQEYADTPSPSEVVIFALKLRTVLNRMKNQFSYLSDFIFWVIADCIYNLRWHIWLFEYLTDQNRPKVAKYTENMCNVQKRMKNQFFRFLVFEIWSILYWNSDIFFMLVGLHPPKPPVFVKLP